ncbi:hypothetical protein BJF78_26225 [Pseudonocardia sp. CNS-139]|nr:hypothetical protein BJF78_26225 [Pseudonocardia sp. CNS-139]
MLADFREAGGESTEYLGGGVGLTLSQMYAHGVLIEVFGVVGEGARGVFEDRDGQVRVGVFVITRGDFGGVDCLDGGVFAERDDPFGVERGGDLGGVGGDDLAGSGRAFGVVGGGEPGDGCMELVVVDGAGGEAVVVVDRSEDDRPGGVAGQDAAQPGERGVEGGGGALGVSGVAPEVEDDRVAAGPAGVQREVDE